MTPDGVLAGRKALVTGAGAGNGAAIARGLARAGAAVLVTDRDGEAAARQAAAIRDAGGAAESATLDVTQEGDCRAVAEAAGEVAILVNNAGVLLRGPAEQAGLAALRRTLEVNVAGMMGMALACLPALRRTGGCVINLASIQSFVAPPGSAGYSASKGAVAQLTKALAAEWAPLGIRVNAIAPGIIATAMSAATRADPERLGRFLLHVPMGRVGEPEELVGPAVFLASPAASYVTGVVLPVDGGFLTV